MSIFWFFILSLVQYTIYNWGESNHCSNIWEISECLIFEALLTEENADANLLASTSFPNWAFSAEPSYLSLSKVFTNYFWVFGDSSCFWSYFVIILKNLTLASKESFLNHAFLGSSSIDLINYFWKNLSLIIKLINFLRTYPYGSFPDESDSKILGSDITNFISLSIAAPALF